MVRKWKKRQEATPEGKWIGKQRAWTGGKEKEVPSPKEAKANDVGKEDAEDHQEGNKEAQIKGSEGSVETRKSESLGGGAAPNPKRRAVEVTKPANGPAGLTELDFGGTGDCGWRAAAAAQAMVNGKEEGAIKEKVATLAAGLRMKAALHLERTRKEWEEGWLPDNEGSPSIEDGPRIGTATEFIEAMKRGRIDGSAAGA